jgi:hypothetical protein
MRDAAMSFHRRVSLAITVVLFSLTLGACGDLRSRLTTERTDSSGVELVMHRGGDVRLGWEFEIAFALGGSGTEQESFTQLAPEDVAVDAEHNIYMLDIASSHVVVFDSSGSLVRTMGSEGDGAGEMQSPAALSVSPTGVASVFDTSKRGLVRFGPAGEVLEEIEIDFPFDSGGIVDRGESMIIPSQVLNKEESTYTEELLSIAGDDTVRMVHFTRPAGRDFILFSCGLILRAIPPVFAPELRWTATDGGVAAAMSSDYEVGFYRETGIVRIIRRAIDPEPASWEAAVVKIGNSVRRPVIGGALPCDAEEVVQARRIADVIPVIDALAAGPGGTLWIKRSTTGMAAGPIDVFEADGTYHGTLSAGWPFPVAVMGDRIAAIETDESQVRRLVVYRVVQ